MDERGSYLSPIMGSIVSDDRSLDALLRTARGELDSADFVGSSRTARAALKLAREIGRRGQEGAALNILGGALLRSGSTEESPSLFEEGLRIALDLGDAELEATSLTNLARYHRLAGNSEQALEIGERSVQVARRIDLPLVLASALLSLGNISERTGDYGRALDLYTEALEIAARTGDLKLEAYAAGNVGIIHERLGETPLALRFNIQSLELKERLDDRWGMGVSYNNIAILYHDLGEYASALEAWMRSLEITEAIGDREGLSAALNGIGMMFEAMGEQAHVLEYYRRSLGLAREIGYVQGEAFSLNHIGRFSFDHDDPTRALLYYYSSLRLFESTGDRYGVRGLLQSIGDVYASLNDVSRATDHYHRGLAITEETGDRMGRCSLLQSIGLLHVAGGNLHQGIEALEQGLEIARVDGYRELERKLLSGMAVAFDGIGERRRAAECRKNYILCTEALFSKQTRRRAAELLFRFERNDARRLGDELGLSSEDIEEALSAIRPDRSASPPLLQTTPIRSSTTPAISVEALGGLRVSINGRELRRADWGRRRARDLFSFLLLRHRRPVTIDEILELLFREEVVDARTRMLVMNAATHLRRALEPDRSPHALSTLLVADKGSYMLDLGEDAWVDFLRFKELIVDARRAATLVERLRLYGEALPLYRGDLFADDPYAPWSAAERDMLRDAWLEGLEYRASEDLRLERFEEAIELARRGLQADPTAERSYEILTAALIARGRTGEAHLVHRAFVEAWHREYGSPPSIEAPHR